MGLDKLQNREQEVERARKAAEARAKRLGVRLADLRDERGDAQKVVHDKAKRERELERKIAKAKKEQRLEDLWTKRDCIDGATTWKGLVLVLNVVEARSAWGGGVNAADRTSHADDCSNKSDQQELYDGWLARLPGFYPANPPGTGSHEGIADATLARVFSGAGIMLGSKLPQWAWGLDLADGPGFEAGARDLGFKVVRPYANESWHVNLTANPTPTLKKLGVV